MVVHSASINTLTLPAHNWDSIKAQWPFPESWGRTLKAGFRPGTWVWWKWQPLSLCFLSLSMSAGEPQQDINWGASLDSGEDRTVTWPSLLLTAQMEGQNVAKTSDISVQWPRDTVVVHAGLTVLERAPETDQGDGKQPGRLTLEEEHGLARK